MPSTSFAWLSLLFLLFWPHDVCSGKLQFVKTPPTQEILPVGSNLTIDCTTNNATAQTAVYYRRSVKRVKWKKIEAIPGIQVAQMGSVYNLIALSRRNAGQYQCRASGGDTNSTETTWPENVGIVIIRGTRNKEKRKKNYKCRVGNKRKKMKNKNTANKKPGQKKPKRKKPGSKKKRISRKRSGKRQPGSRKPGSKRPGTKRPGPKIGGGGKKPGKKDPGPKKIKALLKPLKNLITVNESSLAVLKCTARVQGGQPAIMSWHRKGKMIGCSNKDLRRCLSASTERYHFTYKTSTRDGSRKKYATYLRIPKIRRALDKGIYVCMVTDKQWKPLTAGQTIRLKIVRKRSS